MAQSYGLGILPWSPLAGSLLTGKYRRNNDVDPDSHYARHPAANFRMVDDVYHPEGMEPHVRQKGFTMARFALAWVIHQPGITRRHYWPSDPRAAGRQPREGLNKSRLWMQHIIVI